MPFPEPPPSPVRDPTWAAAEIDWLIRTIVAQSYLLSDIARKVENALMTLNDLNASQDRSEASTSAALAGISQEIQQVRDAVAALGTAPTAAELAAFKARIDANTDRLDAAIAELAGDDPTP